MRKIKDGLTSESFPLWLNLQQKVPNHNHDYQQHKKSRYLALFLRDLSKSEQLSEIKLPLPKLLF